MRRLPILIAAGFTPYAFATNGLNLIGFGAESVTMGGADLAVARDTAALNTNPAGLHQIEGQAFDNYLAVAYPLDVSHADGFRNDTEVSNRIAILGGFGYARHGAGSPLTLGIGLFVQGGAGYVYKDLNTAFGTQDELSSLFGVIKLTPGFSYRVSDTLSFGVSLGIVYSRLKQRIFPETSIFNAAAASQSFFGSKIDHVSAVDYGFKLGLQYRLTSRLTLGTAYTSKTELSLAGGQLQSNQRAAGLGIVTYDDVRIDGLALPQEMGVGLAWRPVDQWLLSLELNWIDWSGALDTTTLTAGDPDNSSAPPVLKSVSILNWRDQYVIAAGLAYDISDKTSLRAGYNYGRNPIPNEATNPLLATIGEHHFTFGVAHEFSERWRLLAGVEYEPASTVTYTNRELPLGADAQERHHLVAIHLMASRRW